MAHKTIDELKELVLTGSEQQVRDFINAQWENFPQDIQDHISSALLIDSLKNSIEKDSQLTDFQESLLGAIETIVSSK